MPEPVRSGILALSAGLIFGGALAGLFLGLRWLHARGARTLLTAAPRFRWAQLALGFGLSAAMVGGASWLLDPASVKPLSSVDPRALAFGALALLVGFSIQSSAEEILFRGYILQGKSGLFSSFFQLIAQNIWYFFRHKAIHPPKTPTCVLNRCASTHHHPSKRCVLRGQTGRCYQGT